MQWPDQGVKWPECGGSWGLDGCKKARWPAAGGCLAALGRGLGTWRGDNDPDVEIRAKAAPPALEICPFSMSVKERAVGRCFPTATSPPACTCGGILKSGLRKFDKVTSFSYMDFWKCWQLSLYRFSEQFRQANAFTIYHCKNKLVRRVDLLEDNIRGLRKTWE